MLLPQIKALDPTQQNLEEKASFLISTTQNANNSITQTISQLQNKNILIPQQCIDTFKEAQSLANKATQANHQGDYSQAIEFALQATQKIKTSLHLLDGLVEEASTENGDSYKQTLQNTINRYYSLLQRYEDITTSTSNSGTDVTTIRAKLSTLKTVLNSSKSYLDHEEFELAENEITQAQELIDELTGYFNTIATRLNFEKISTYIANTQQNLTALKEQINSPSSTLTSNTRAVATATITQAQTSLDKARQYLDNQQISQTIDELTNVQANQATVQSYLNPTSPTPTTTTPTPSPNVSITNSTNTTTSTK
jgi:hypothetical protein